jgi:hypothetical protein
MFNKKSSFVPAAFILISFLGVSAANAQDSACPYTLASLQGSYAVIGTYGANVAIALGMVSYDGNGNLASSFVVNEPTPGSTTGARTLVTGTQAGTYTVNCNGTGVITRILTLADGTKSTGTDDFVITSAVRTVNGISYVFLATSIVNAQRTPSTIVPGGIFLTRTLTRLPN